jgi:hypothetical protein
MEIGAWKSEHGNPGAASSQGSVTPEEAHKHAYVIMGDVRGSSFCDALLRLGGFGVTLLAVCPNGSSRGKIAAMIEIETRSQRVAGFEPQRSPLRR